MKPQTPKPSEPSNSTPKKEPPFYNCHTHIFNFKHVNSGFLKGMIPLWLGFTALVLAAFAIYFIYEIIIQFLSLNWVWMALKGLLGIVLLGISLLLLLVVLFSVIPINIHKFLERRWINKITWVLNKIIPGEFDSLVRYANFILHTYDTARRNPKTQREILEELQSYFPEKTRFVLLSMDLDYMVDCRKPPANTTFYDQLNELRGLKNSPEFRDTDNNEDILSPFIHADPRRLSQDKGFYKYLKEGLLSGDFSGIKLYPPLGYFPFDIRLKPVYDLALEHNLPIMTHCSMGPVWYRGSLRTLRNDGYFKGKEFRHPITDVKLEGRNSRSFTPHFTHPLNYFYLMNCPQELGVFWQRCIKEKYFDLEHLPMGEFTEEYLNKYKNLKICLGHYGGSLEWRRYMDNAWLPTERLDLSTTAGIKNIIHGKNGMWKYNEKEIGEHKSKGGKKLKAMNWFSIISKLLQHTDKAGVEVFPNLYADISYNLSDHRMHPLLKVRLETDSIIRKKILFGTDFYMVAMKMTERRATINLRAFLGEDNFRQIAVENPQRFLK